MKYKIAITDFPAFNVLHENISDAKETFDFDYFKVSEMAAADMLLSGKSNLALLTPTAFATISKKGNWRILNSTILVSKGYSEQLSISFKQSLKSIESIFAEESIQHIENIIKILFAERFDIDVEFLHKASDRQKADGVLCSKSGEHSELSIDISEDWYDTFEFALPLAFWVVPAELEDYSVVNLTHKLKDELTPDVEPISELSDNSKYEARSGEIFWGWNDEVEQAIDETVDLLYYHHCISDIIDIKIFGRDYSNDD